MASIMESGKQTPLKVLKDDSGKELIDGQICFSCEQIFADRQCLEDHECSSTSFICSCGTEFTEYKNMQEHSTMHEPGHQVLNHKTIRKRRIEKHIEEDQQLKRLQTGEVVWKLNNMSNVPPGSLPVNTMLQAPTASVTHMPQIHMQSAQMSKVPQSYTSVSQGSSQPNSVNSGKEIKKIFADVGAPTVDLWTLYQPVVLLPTMPTKQELNKEVSYSCGKCGQCFLSKASLVCHYNLHITDKVSGCIGCGLLLSSKTFVPRFHVCNLPKNPTKFKLVTAKPLNYKKLNQAITKKSFSQRAQQPQPNFSSQLKSLNPIAASKCSETPCATANPAFKNKNVRAYSKNNNKLRVNPHLQSSPSSSASSLYEKVSVPPKTQCQNPAASLKSSQEHSVTSSRKIKPPTVAELIRLKSSAPNEFICRVCHCHFETPQLLQRHKCAKAQEFMAQHVRRGRNCTLNKVIPVANSIPASVNGERKLGMPASGNIKLNQVITLDEGEVDMDDDCYIVESGPGKPAEMIYQVTSSVPIKI